MADATDQENPLAREWEPLSTWATATGHAQLVNLRLDNNLAYSTWLAKALEDESTDGGETVPLTQLQADCSRAAGYRQVHTTGLRKKMQDIFSARAWRVWDRHAQSQTIGYGSGNRAKGCGAPTQLFI